MNNYSLMSADRATHLKIVAVSLIAGILVVGIGLAARTGGGDSVAAVSATGKMQATGPVIRAGQPVTSAASDLTAIR
ncbi:MAG: hypothetical protein AB7K04_11200 [Pseudorhodoplanes sp.]